MDITNRLLKLIKPFIIWWGKIHFPFTHKKITGEHYYKLRDSIDIGTGFLTKTLGEFSNLINPIDLKHGAIYVGDIKKNGIRYVAEAIGKGVVLTDLVTFLTTKDIIVVVRPNFIGSKEEFETTLQKETLRFIGIPYDYMFQRGKKAFYCFELVASCFLSVYPEIQFKSKEIVKGKRIYDSNTFLDKELFSVLFDSRMDKLWK